MNPYSIPKLAVAAETPDLSGIFGTLMIERGVAGMNSIRAVLGLFAIGLLLSGCGTSVSRIMGGGDPSAEPEVQARANPDLSIPPDLQLRPPGSAPAASSPLYDATPQQQSAPTEDYSRVATAPAPVPQGDIYERNGISKVHPDGTPKTDAELKAELKKLYLDKKKRADPKYGTVFNIGNIFRDD